MTKNSKYRITPFINPHYAIDALFKGEWGFQKFLHQTQIKREGNH